MRVRVIRIQHDHNAFSAVRHRQHLICNGVVNGRALNHFNALKHWMRLNLGAVVIANININTEHTAVIAEQLQHRRVKDQRTAMRDTGLNNEIRLGVPNDFLQRREILRKLNDRATEPGEIVGILVRRNGVDPVDRSLPHRRIGAQPLDVFLHFGNETGHFAHFTKSFQQTVRGAITSRPACPQFANKSSALTNGVKSPCNCG